MATQGFEFAYMLDGSGATPLIMDLPVHGTGAYAVGDVVRIASDGQCAVVTGALGEVTGVMAEARASGTDGASMKVVIATHEQVWRCSMDAATTAFIIGYTKTIDVADQNTISATDSSGGSMAAIDLAKLDDEGNVLAYVVFLDTTFGNT